MDREEYYSTQEAAKVLGLSERRIRQLVNDRILDAKRDGHSWKLLRYSVHNYRDEHGVSERPRDAATWPVEARETLEEVKDLRYQLGRVEGRLELEAVTRSTLEDSLQRERERADRLDGELTELRQHLETIRNSWWYRFFH
jgi:excisionase family DNA binding protein